MRNAEARDILQGMTARSSKRHVPPYYIAVVHVGLDETDMAFEWLERAIADGSIWCLDLERDRKLDALSSDRRFESLLRQCGLTPLPDRLRSKSFIS